MAVLIPTATTPRTNGAPRRRLAPYLQRIQVQIALMEAQLPTAHNPPTEGDQLALYAAGLAVEAVAYRLDLAPSQVAATLDSYPQRAALEAKHRQARDRQADKAYADFWSGAVASHRHGAPATTVYAGRQYREAFSSFEEFEPAYDLAIYRLA